MAIPNAFSYRQQVWVTPLGIYAGLHAQRGYDEAQRRLHRARIVRRPQMVRTDTGEELSIDVQAWILSMDRSILTTDRIELPDQSVPTIVRVYDAPDPRGQSRVFRVLFGASRRAGTR